MNRYAIKRNNRNKIVGILNYDERTKKYTIEDVYKRQSLVKSARSHPTPRESELKVLDRTKGAEEQVSYLDGVEVSPTTTGATRPDVVVKNADGSIKAIEVKNYNLASSNSRYYLNRELKRQVTNRVNNLPLGSTQEIVLDEMCIRDSPCWLERRTNPPVPVGYRL